MTNIKNLPLIYTRCGDLNCNRVLIQKKRPVKGFFYGFANEHDEIVIPCEFDYALDFHQGYAVVRKNNEWGIIKEDGTFLIDYDYDLIYSFNDEGIALALKNNRNYWITTTGEILHHREELENFLNLKKR